MAQIINTNMMSLNAQRNLTTTQGVLSQAIQRLSTGLRVNSAKDDAAGLAIAERMNAQVRGMNVAIRNANDGISMAQTAEGALSKMGDMLQRMRELAVQSANGTLSADDRDNLNEEFGQLSEEITRTIAVSKFNETEVLNLTADLDFQVGANKDETITIASADFAMTDVTAALSLSIAGADGTTAADALDTIDTALDALNSQRSTWGAVQNRFEAAIGTLQVSAENQAAARSRIMDADFAAETAALTRAQVLQQAGTAMLSQANSIPNNVLTLLR
ncbi:MAG: flagellin [Lautropia sp.]